MNFEDVNYFTGMEVEIVFKNENTKHFGILRTVKFLPDAKEKHFLLDQEEREVTHSEVFNASDVSYINILK